MAASSSSAVVGIPEGQWITDNEDVKWLTIFPAEIWQAIVDSVTDPAVMYNMAKASPFLERFLESQRTVYLLYPVLKIRDLRYQSTGSQLLKPNLCDYLGTKELLKCRLVCTSWKSAVDQFLVSRPHHSTVSLAALVPVSGRDAFFGIPVPKERRQDPAYPAYFRLQHFAGEGWRETGLLSEMSSSSYADKPTDHCPSPTRHLEIKEDSTAWNWSNRDCNRIKKAQYCREYREKKKAKEGGGGGNPPQPPRLDRNFDFVKNFLDKVGPSFHHLTIQADSYKTIQEYVQLMSNLKSLYITARTNWKKGEMEDIGTSFSTLKNLNLVSLNGLPEPASKLIFDENPGSQIVELFRYHPDLQGQKKTGNCLVPWPQNPVRIATTITFTDELGGMPVAWKLDVLKLNFSEERFVNWGTIFNKLECYQDTLTELRLELPLPPNDAPFGWVLTNTWEASMSQLNLPNLKRLEVKVGKLSSLDFLLGLTSIFRKVECYRDTLSQVYLQLPGPRWPEMESREVVQRSIWEASKEPLNLPGLTMLEVKARTFCSLDFLLGLGSLEYLCLGLDSNEEEKIKFVSEIQVERINCNRDFPGGFMECNIWELMASLKEVDMRIGELPIRKYKRKMA